MRSEKEYMEFPGQQCTLIMKLSSDESQKLCGNLKESCETLQMSASKEAIPLERLQQSTVEQIIDVPVSQIREEI